MQSSNILSDLAEAAGFRAAQDRVLAPSEVHVWLRGASSKDIREAPSVANANNRDSQAALTAVLAMYAGTRPEDLTIQRGPHGKPFLEGGPHFNLSHSAGAMAIAVGAVEVGLDIEHPARPVSAEALATKFFMEEECRHLMAASPSTRATLFLQYWVRKEAMTKLAGEGIYRGLRFAKVEIDRPTGAYRKRQVIFTNLGGEIGMTGVLATWEPVRVKVFVIPPKSAIML